MAEKALPKLIQKANAFCPGCGHGIVSRIIAEVLEEHGMEDKTIMTVGVGCSWNINQNWGGDMMQTAHGRAGATATGVKAARPDLLSITYQGDGDAYVIGIAETLNAAYRNTPITAFVINNNNFGMTGGQMSWTTMPGQMTTTSPAGRNPKKTGFPMRVPEMIASFEEIGYVARGSVHNAKEIMNLKKYISNAIEAQLAGEGYSIVEILAPCPTNWHKDVKQSIEWIENEVVPYFNLGELRGRSAK